MSELACNGCASRTATICSNLNPNVTELARLEYTGGLVVVHGRLIVVWTCTTFAHPRL